MIEKNQTILTILLIIKEKLERSVNKCKKNIQQQQQQKHLTII